MLLTTSTTWVGLGLVVQLTVLFTGPAKDALTMQTRNHSTGGVARGEKPTLQNFSPQWKNVLDIVQKIWAPLRKHFAHPRPSPGGVPSWLRACNTVILVAVLHYCRISWKSSFPVKIIMIRISISYKKSKH